MYKYLSYLAFLQNPFYNTFSSKNFQIEQYISKNDSVKKLNTIHIYTYSVQLSKTLTAEFIIKIIL